MKKALFSILAVAVVATSLTSCKKGENDPAISFKSRKGRLAGTWNVSAMDKTTTSNNSGTVTTVTNTYENNQRVEVTTIGTAPAVTNKYNLTETLTIEKDGSFTWNSAETWVESQGTAITTAPEQKIDVIGTWAFNGKSKTVEQKNKESFSIFPTSVTYTALTTDVTTYTGWHEATTWVIDQLKSKELIIKHDDSWTDNSGDTGSTTGTTTYTKA